MILLKASADLPMFIFAHSMGCLVTTTFLLNNPNLNLAGVVLNSGMLDGPKSLN